MTTLYFSPATCSLAPHIVLREAGHPFTLEKVDLSAKTVNGGADFNRVNPKSYVPVLRFDDGQVLTEGAVIMQYVADQRPESRLVPKNGTLDRCRLQEWLNFLASEVHKAFGPLFNAQAGEDWKAHAATRLSARFDWLSRQLESSTFLMGDQFTVADAYLFTLLNWTTFDFVPLDLAKWPVLKSYHQRIADRPKVREAMKAEGLVG